MQFSVFCLSSYIGVLEYQKIVGKTAEQFEFYMGKGLGFVQI